MLAGSIGKTYVSAAFCKSSKKASSTSMRRSRAGFGSDGWFPRLPNAKDITLRMLMNHSSGIPERAEQRFHRGDEERYRSHLKPEELIAYILDAKPLFAAGHGWSYADTNYILAG